MATPPKFSLLLPVWERDDPELLRRALTSAVDDQLLPPDQVVVVLDGPVPAAISDCVERLRARSAVPMRVVALNRHRGLGPALDRGLAACEHDVIARMDADDIALPNRFAVQIPLMADLDIVGAGLVEFTGNPERVVGTRVPPTGQRQIARYARLHDPFNHPTVVYRRSAVIAAGGYGDLALMEDYWLFGRMLANGARADNVAEPLVCYRVGATAFKRRGGATLLRSEMRLQRQFREEGFTTRAQYTRNMVVRCGYRLVPWWVRRVAYRSVVSRYGKHAPTVPVLAHTAPVRLVPGDVAAPRPVPAQSVAS